jgi:hypothetical protein
MVAVGLSAVTLGGRAVWIMPGAFVGAMIVGVGLAMAGAPLPFVEPVILASVVVLGLVVATAIHLPTARWVDRCLSAAFPKKAGSLLIVAVIPRGQSADTAVALQDSLSADHRLRRSIKHLSKAGGWMSLYGAGQVSGTRMRRSHADGPSESSSQLIHRTSVP